ncbi:hypothetical protein [Nitrosomonas communis]
MTRLAVIFLFIGRELLAGNCGGAECYELVYAVRDINDKKFFIADQFLIF